MTTATGDEIVPGSETPGTPIADAQPGSVLQPLTTGYRRYALWMLMIIYTLNFLDRSVINILAEPIKEELGLSDTQLGMMSGFAFAVFYTVLGIPIARLAERKNRPVIIGISVAAWSAFTALSGFAQNFVQLLLARIGVGVGEAGCSPPAHSLIVDYVPKEKRASAIAFYSIGTPLGSLLGLLIGGLVAESYGWRTAFLVCGAPGIIIALFAIFTLPEPRKKLNADIRAKNAAGGPSLSAAVKILRSKRTFWLIAGAAAIKALIGYGHAPFTASFFLRVHNDELELRADQLSAFFNGVFGTSMDLGPLGFLSIALSVVAGLAGVLGTVIGGAVSDRFAQKDLRAYVVIPAILSLLAIPLYMAALLTPSVPVAVMLLAVVALFGSFWYGPVYATAQSIVEPRMRATTAALLLFIINLIGLGMGPVAVGALSDGLSVGAGMGAAEGIRWALIATEFLNILAFALFWMARKTIREETVS
jgi:MFS family permease